MEIAGRPAEFIRGMRIVHVYRGPFTGWYETTITEAEAKTPAAIRREKQYLASERRRSDIHNIRSPGS